jgi:hypothetical protein
MPVRGRQTLVSKSLIVESENSFSTTFCFWVLVEDSEGSRWHVDGSTLPPAPAGNSIFDARKVGRYFKGKAKSFYKMGGK